MPAYLASIPRQTEMRALDSELMIGRVTKRVARFALVVSVSLWMAGAGCMWGCSNMTASAQSLSNTPPDQTTVVASASCHAKTHDCCAKGSQKQTASTPNVEVGLSWLLSTVTEGMMKDCPLAIRASAVSTSKSTEGTSDLAISSAVQAFRLDLADNVPVVPTIAIQFLNRGPTYLRCCVFLI